MDKISVVNFFLSYPKTSLENNDLKEEIKKLQYQLQQEYKSGIPKHVETSSVEERLERIDGIQEHIGDIYSKMYATVQSFSLKIIPTIFTVKLLANFL